MSVTITYAGYGARGNTRDATAAIRRAYAEGSRTFWAGNDWVGDPAPGEGKMLCIVWDQDGIACSGIVAEDDEEGITLP